MDAVTLIVTALGAGAASGAIEVLQGDVKDRAVALYAKLHELVKGRFHGNPAAEVILDEHRADPATYQQPLAKKLTAAGVQDDADLVGLAETLMELLDHAGAQHGKYNVRIDNSPGSYVGDNGIQVNRFGS